MNAGFEVREVTVWRVVCHYPGCPWSQRHDDPDAARRDGVRHVAEWHGNDDLRAATTPENKVVGLMHDLESAIARAKEDRAAEVQQTTEVEP